MSQKNLFHTLQHYWISHDWLGHRMLFLSGPRQVGKTTLVTSSLCTNPSAYFNWDSKKVRQNYQQDPEFFSTVGSKWICFDEIHKRPKWKDILKGTYDVFKNKYQFVITGSAKLDTFKKSGDSLVGRYFHTHLFPINLPDLVKNNFLLPEHPDTLLQRATDLNDEPALETLLSVGGFPEPFFSASETFWKRWSRNHHELILSEDLRDLNRIVEIDKVENLLHLLKQVPGQIFSNNHAAQDLETSHTSVKRWLKMLAGVQLIFEVPPYFKNIRKAYKSEKKWYFMDWRMAENNLFENFVAASLYRATQLYQDRYGENLSLHFIRTHNGTEVDFLICREQKPWLLIEAKEGKPQISPAIYRFTKELRVPGVIVTRLKNYFKKIKGPEGQTIYAISWGKFGQVLP